MASPACLDETVLQAVPKLTAADTLRSEDQSVNTAESKMASVSTDFIVLQQNTHKTAHSTLCEDAMMELMDTEDCWQVKSSPCALCGFPSSRRCYSCASWVCSDCMAQGESCFDCLTIFPVRAQDPASGEMPTASGEMPWFSSALQAAEQRTQAPLTQDTEPNAKHGAGGKRKKATKVKDWLVAQEKGKETKEQNKERTTTETRGEQILPTSRTGMQMNEEETQEEDDERSLMLCNIPCRLGHDDLVDAINGMGFTGLYDFVHLPPARHWPRGKAKSTLRNVGYAFVHFNLAEDASDFANKFQGHQFRCLTSDKRCVVQPAHLNLRQKEVHRAQATQDLEVKDCDPTESCWSTAVTGTPDTSSSEQQTATPTLSTEEGYSLNGELSNAIGEDTLSARLEAKQGVAWADM